MEGKKLKTQEKSQNSSKKLKTQGKNSRSGRHSPLSSAQVVLKKACYSCSSVFLRYLFLLLYVAYVLSTYIKWRKFLEYVLTLRLAVWPGYSDSDVMSSLRCFGGYSLGLALHSWSLGLTGVRDEHYWLAWLHIPYSEAKTLKGLKGCNFF